MHNGAIGPRSSDGVEAEVLQGPGLFAKALQHRHRGDLVGQVQLRFRRQPMQKAHQGRPVADMGLARALHLRGVLAGARQHGGILAAHNRGADGFKLLEIPGRRLGRVDQHALPRQSGQGARQGRRIDQRHLMAQPFA